MSRLESGIYAGRESLVTHSLALSTVGDNVANSNTPGFKDSRVDFGDLLADSVGSLYGSPLQAGNGVRSLDITTNHRLQGSFDQTGRELDAALQGNGFFILNDGTNSFYTRAGNFLVAADGTLRALSGENVMGFTAASPDALVPLTTNDAVATANASTAMTIAGNLAADTAPDAVAPGAAPADFAALNDAATFRTAVEVTDSLGTRQPVSLYYFHDGLGTWTSQAYVDGAQVGGVAGTPVLVGTGAMTFDGTGLQAEGAAPLVITPPWGNGAAAGNVSIDQSAFTQFAGTSAVSNLTVDGNSAGNFAGLGYRQDGSVVVQLSNGEEVSIGQLGIGIFASPDGLDRVGDNKFRETDQSGAVAAGLANTEGRGTVIGSALENSTVDPTKEFISLIRYQRGYQAGTQVITTIDELIGSTIQLA